MKMIRKRNSTSMLALALILVAVLACNLLNETDKANKLVDEGNAAVQDGRKFLTEAEEKRQAMMTALPDIKSAEEPVAARGLAKDAIAHRHRLQSRMLIDELPPPFADDAVSRDSYAQLSGHRASAGKGVR